MERIRDTKSPGITAAALRTWGMVFLAMGIVATGILQNRLLRLGEVSPGQLLQAMQSSDSVMAFATLALVLRAVATCAVPIFALLLVEGARHTGSFRNYFLRVAGLALLSEIPYNLAISGRVLDLTTRNPAFGLAVGLFMLWLYGRFPGKNFSRVLIRGMVTLAAVLWCAMLSVECGGCLVFVTAVLWAFREKPLTRNIAGACASLVCCLSSMFYMASPMGFLAVHLYNGEKGEQNRLVNYLTYPALLLLTWLAAALLTA